jgi:ABC-type sulfate transport system permease subunit
MRFSVSPIVAAISTILILATLLILIVFHRVAGIETLFGSRRPRT